MRNTPIDFNIVNNKIAESRLTNVGRASIRELKKLIDDIEQATGEKYIRMEMGIPGLPPAQIGVEAEIEALKQGVASIYPDIQGVPELKNEISRFIKNYANIEVPPHTCFPTVGSMMGSFACFMTLNRCNPEKDTLLFIDPGFSTHKVQMRVLGQKQIGFDVYNYRGEKLRDKLESFLSKGNIHSLLYSNPNNPSWICFTENELQIIAEVAKKYDVVVIEDLAYFGMDFRRDISKPAEPPYQPTIARYYDQYILLISSSKAFSYAGQRVGMMAISEALFNREFDGLLPYYNTKNFGHAIVFGTIYAISAGTCHSAQWALAAILKACNESRYNFVKETYEYAEKAKIMKKLFTDNGFYIVYDKDEDEPIADGFYFTIAYPGMSGDELAKELLYYGISAITLSITGSERTEGLRACVSLVKREQFPILEYRLKRFREDHPF